MASVASAMSAILVAATGLFAAPAYAASIEASPPTAIVSFIILPNGQEEASVDLRATATFDPKPGQAFASFQICGPLGGCTSHTAPVTGSGTYTAELKQIHPLPTGHYTVIAIWEGNGLKYFGERVPSGPTPFDIPHWNRTVKDTIKGAMIRSAVTGVLSCGAIAGAAALSGGAAALATGKYLGATCATSLLTLVGGGIALYYDPTDEAVNVVAVPQPVLAPRQPMADCAGGAACVQVTARLVEYDDALRKTTDLFVALAKTANRITTAQQKNDSENVSLQISASKILFAQLADAIDAEHAAGLRLAQALKDNTTTVTVTDAQVQAVMQDGAWISQTGPEAKAALDSLYIDTTGVLDILRRARQEAADLNDWTTALLTPEPTAAMREFAGRITTADLRAVITSLAASGELPAALSQNLTSAVPGDCVDPAGKQRALGLLSSLPNENLKRYLTTGISNQPGASAKCTPPTLGPIVSASAASGKKQLPTSSIVHSGGFEPGDGVPDAKSSGFMTLSATVPVQAKLGPWTIKNSCVDLVYDAKASTEGNQFVDLNGNCGAGSPATIEQAIATVSGHRYEITLYLAGNQNGDPKVKNMRVEFGGTSQDLTFDITGLKGGDLGWASRTFTVTAHSDRTVLQLVSTTKGIRGPLVDGVSVVDAGPAFPWLWVILGVLLLALLAAGIWFLLRRRRRATKTPTAVADLGTQ